eukprot:scaffold79575_cov63-Phaeocystis_antarctica.AAC.2
MRFESRSFCVGSAPYLAFILASASASACKQRQADVGPRPGAMAAPRSALTQPRSATGAYHLLASARN